MKYNREVIVYASGMVVKSYVNGYDWSEYPCLYDNGNVGFDRPEVFSKKERRFIAQKLTQLRK